MTNGTPVHVRTAHGTSTALVHQDQGPHVVVDVVDPVTGHVLGERLVVVRQLVALAEA